ncbi:MAG: T9SS type A sorting domain-containing protein [Ignavibacteria bacterium]|nr:T9SS type A sorting domain-containing protein [Ignavibacteria bacterium]
MNDDHLSMDERLDRARQLPPLVSLDAAGRFLNSNSAASAAPAVHTFHSQPRTYLLAGGAMAVIVVLVLAYFMANPQTPEQAQLSASEQTTNRSMLAHADDSARAKPHSRPGRERESSRNTRTSARKPLAPATTVTEPSARLTGSPFTLLHATNRSTQAPTVSFASCTPERIDGFTLYDLDSAELSRIGIVVLPNGSIKHAFSDEITETMTEHSGGIVVWTYRIPKKRIRLEGSTSKLHPTTRGDTIHIYPENGLTLKTDESIDELKAQTGANGSGENSRSGTILDPTCVVLITNIEGRTYSYLNSMGSPASLEEDYQIPDFTKQSVKRPATTKSIQLESGSYTLQDLIPIRVRNMNGARNKTSADYFYVYWYEPSEKVLSALPERVRRSVNAIREKRKQRLIPQIQGGTSVLPNSIDVNLFPNPVTRDVTTVRFTLPEPSRVAVSLYDILGKRVRELTVCEERNAGICESTLDFRGIQAGVYMLAVTTERGQQAVQKIVVQR